MPTDISNLLTCHIPEGYYGGMSGQRYAEPVPCDVCNHPVSSLSRYERNYPDDPDIWVCDQCIFEAGLEEG